MLAATACGLADDAEDVVAWRVPRPVDPTETAVGSSQSAPRLRECHVMQSRHDAPDCLRAA